MSRKMSIESLFTELAKVWPKFDGFVHSIGFAPADQLDGDYVNAVTREGFKIAHDISAYSFVAMAKACRGMLNPGSALLTLSYLGAERAIPNYNVMGLAKPLKLTCATWRTPWARKAFALTPSLPVRSVPWRLPVLKISVRCWRTAKRSPRSVAPSPLKTGNSAAFLCSDLSAGISGEVVHVDGGFSIAAMNELELK